VLFADLLSTAGSGIVLPFLAIYAGRVRDLGPTVGAAAVAAIAVGSLPANLLAGAAADRFGARRVLITGWILAAAGDLVLLRSGHAATVLAAAVLIGLGVGSAYPATSTLLAEVTPARQRSLVFALQYGLSNVGLSLGIGASAVIVAVPDLHRFQLIYLVDAATFLIAATVLVRAAALAPVVDEDPGRIAGGSPGGYRKVASDNAFRWLCLVQVLLVVFGYAQFHAALPLYLSRPDGLAPSLIAVVFIANTVFVALTALPAGRLAQRILPLRLITAGAICFALSWLLLWQSRGANWPSVALAIGAAVVMGLGEILLAPAVGPLVNQLSPDELRGRYNALNALILSVGTIIGPGLVALLNTGASAGPLFLVLTAGCLTAALLTSRRLAPERVRGGDQPRPVPPLEPEPARPGAEHRA
jgi:MFS family permease